ncbi:MAG: N-acetylmuramoyl-L-alanine amidase, partial [Candidatus Zixiibacteriota bacterium]
NQNRGAIGPVEGIAEQWVNLNVAMELAEILGPSNYVLTRHNDTENVSLQVRAQIANASGDLLISIHHNGLPLGMQATEMRWCGDSLNSNGLPRQNDFSDSTFAKKALYKLLDAFGYDDRCRILHQGDPIGMGCQDCDGDPWLIKIVSKDNSRSGALCS